jgi:hypothetical protein
MKTFELLIVMRFEQKAVDASDAASRLDASLMSALNGKDLFPNAGRKCGYWDETLGARLIGDRPQVLMWKEKEVK